MYRPISEWKGSLKYLALESRISKVLNPEQRAWVSPKGRGEMSFRGNLIVW